jgi:creatinine amidohydrolase
MHTNSKREWTVAMFAAVVLSLQACPTAGQTRAAEKNTTKPDVYRIEELTAPEIDALDRGKTPFILPVGMLEEHGPHLPIATDTYRLNFIVDETAKRLQQKLPSWSIVVLPDVNYGEGGANGFSGNSVDPGTYGIRYTTLRAILADIGGQISANKFKWIFVIHAHGAPMNSIAISEACDFVSDTFSMTMLNITSLRWADAEYSSKSDKIAAKYYSSADLQAQGMDIHAGTAETSDMLAIDPQRVRPVYKALPDRAGKNPDELVAIAEKPGWEGYFGRPAKASGAYGRELMEFAVEESADFILRALRGENFSKHSRYPEGSIPGPYTEPPEQQAFTAKLDQWLRQRK